MLRREVEVAGPASPRGSNNPQGACRTPSLGTDNDASQSQTPPLHQSLQCSCRCLRLLHRSESGWTTMSISIELGRAVLSSPATDHELWLTTFITISPKQDATHLQQLTSAEYLDALISGAVWVSRGHDMHIDMTLSLRDELLPNKQLQDLATAVLDAPVGILALFLGRY